MLHQSTTNVEVLIPIDPAVEKDAERHTTTPDAWPFSVSVNLRRLTAQGELAPGRWDVRVRVCAGPLAADAPLCASACEEAPSASFRDWRQRVSRSG